MPDFTICPQNVFHYPVNADYFGSFDKIVRSYPKQLKKQRKNKSCVQEIFRVKFRSMADIARNVFNWRSI